VLRGANWLSEAEIYISIVRANPAGRAGIHATAAVSDEIAAAASHEGRSGHQPRPGVSRPFLACCGALFQVQLPGADHERSCAR
jgi:hypothetical protein